ncbi:MAG: metal-dependent transcriptional regulator [Candidatus Magnetomorum sp.]|nr:metal-dependent transcriptional regulator [Candidatus Magnetomorum sp.]
MIKATEKEEYLEKLWNMKENNADDINQLTSAMNSDSNSSVIQEMLVENLIIINNDKVAFTDTGEEKARKIIRAHRLAERLIFDALGGDYESGACEFEHIVNSELVDSICILLGHPRECPHGRPIPEGDCCKSAVKTAECAVMPLTEMEPQQSSRVAYVNGYQKESRLNKIDDLQIRSGVMIRMEQKKPAIVIQCEGADIALDDNVASDIYVWKECTRYRSKFEDSDIKAPDCVPPKRFGFMRRARFGRKACNQGCNNG